MRARPPIADSLLIATQFEAAPWIGRVRAMRETYGEASAETVGAILDEAAKFAEQWLVPLNDSADAVGCTIVDGRVRTAPGHREAWAAYVEAGWPTLDQPAEVGGQGLPLAVAVAVQEIFDRACPAFGMLPVPQRSAARLIAAHGEPQLQAEWLPELASGSWGATICISEPDAGSDVGRIRTIATPAPDGSWTISGEKAWISFGDHDLAKRIGHCLLARTPGAAAGGAGLSLFLVPDRLDDGSANGVVVRRLEHKLGLHASPTCILGFDGARGQLLGQVGRGLAQMFVMITNMRLSVGVQGVGIASGATDVAHAYAADRRQGGPIGASVTIDQHADVRRMLRGMNARVDMLRGLILAIANAAEIAAHDPDPEERADAGALTQWLLPIVKTTGGEVAFDTADDAIQVLGGAGYTREWPVEQALRDARVLTIFEGTTGIQALDLAERRLLRGDARGYHVFLRAARAAASETGIGERLSAVLDALEAASSGLRARPEAAPEAATAYLHLAALAALGWIAARHVDLPGEDEQAQRLRASAVTMLADLDLRCAFLRDQILRAVAT